MNPVLAGYLSKAAASAPLQTSSGVKVPPLPMGYRAGQAAKSVGRGLSALNHLASPLDAAWRFRPTSANQAAKRAQYSGPVNQASMNPFSGRNLFTAAYAPQFAQDVGGDLGDLYNQTVTDRNAGQANYNRLLARARTQSVPYGRRSFALPTESAYKAPVSQDKDMGVNTMGRRAEGLANTVGDAITRGRYSPLRRGFEEADAKMAEAQALMAKAEAMEKRFQNMKTELPNMANQWVNTKEEELRKKYMPYLMGGGAAALFAPFLAQMMMGGGRQQQPIIIHQGGGQPMQSGANYAWRLPHAYAR